VAKTRNFTAIARDSTAKARDFAAIVRKFRAKTRDFTAIVRKFTAIAVGIKNCSKRRFSAVFDIFMEVIE
jgi:hypothetical protein